nr:hypothetical protein [Tanacetum cinerariifolium]
MGFKEEKLTTPYSSKGTKKFGFTEVKNATTPIETQKPLLKDEDGEEVDVHMYMSMIGSLMYLTSSRPDIMFAVCCKKQTVVANSTTEAKYVAASSCCGQIHAKVNGKKIIVTKSYVRRDLQLADEEGIDSLLNSTIFKQLALMGKGFSGRVTPLFPTMVVQNQAKIGEGLAIPMDHQYTPTILQPSTSQPQQTHKPRKPKRKVTQVPQLSGPTESFANEIVYKKLDDRLVRAATTASSLEAKQDSGNIDKTQSKEKPNDSSSQGTDTGGGPKCQGAMGDTIAQTRVESSDNEEILGEDASKQEIRIDDIDADEDITLLATSKQLLHRA